MSFPDRIPDALLPGEPTGYISTHGAYLAPAPHLFAKDDPFERAIILLTDGFGLPLKNSKILADNLAHRLDCDVWVPDYFRGRPFFEVDSMNISGPPGPKMSSYDWIKRILKTIPRIPAFIHSRPRIVDARLAKFIHAIQEERQYATLGAVGYCHGGSTAIRLASTDMIQSVVVCHPGRFTLPQVNAIKVPSAWVCAEENTCFKRSLRLKAEATLLTKRGTPGFCDYEFKDYQGTTGGFAYRPNLSEPHITKAYEKAFQQTADWFLRTLIL